MQSPNGPFGYLDHAGSIATGGVAQEVAPPNNSRKAIFVYNESDTNMRVCFGNQSASATVGFLLLPGYYWESPAVSNGRVTIYCATTGKNYSCGEWS